MSSNKISIEPQAVYEVMKRMKRLVESTNAAMSAVNMSLVNAELGQWNDKSFYLMKEEYEIAQRHLKDGIRHLETIVIPQLNKTIKAIEGFSSR